MLRRTAAASLRSAQASWCTAGPLGQHDNAVKEVVAPFLSFCSASEPDVDTNPAPSEKVVKLADAIENLSVKEVVWLNKTLKERLGISDADLGMGMSMGMAQMAAAPVAGGADGAGEAAPEKSSFDVVIGGFDASAKIKIIKEVRTVLPELGLKEAKALVRPLRAS